ncbi:MAG: hypothetical protein AAGG50_08995 [Bacteroidota bacterium]
MHVPPSGRRASRQSAWTLYLFTAAAVFLVWFSTPTASAQEEPRAVETTAGDIRLRLSGTFQPRFSYGTTTETDEGADDQTQRVGFGVRRARFRFTARFAQFGVHYDVDFGSGNLDSVDLYGSWFAAERWRLRMGYLAGPQPRGYIFTSHTRIDAIDRAAIAERWSRGTIGSRGRVFGLETRYQTEEITLELLVHNGEGSFDRTRANFRESPSGSSVTRRTDQTRLAVATFAAYEPAALPGFEVGGYVGYNGSRNPNTALDDDLPGRDYLGYSAHVYWGSYAGTQPIRLKAEIIGIRYFERDGMAMMAPSQSELGYMAFGAVRVFGFGEVFARWEQYYDDLDDDPTDFITAGGSYSFSKRRGLDYRQERITLAYANQLPGAPASVNQHLVVLQFQFVF